MKAKITGMSTLQSTPISGTLTVWPDERFEDGNGNATVGRMDYVLDVPTLTWRNAQNPSADAYVVVSAPGEPYPITAMFDEVFVFAGRPPVKQHYRRYLQASDLYATEFSYTERQNVRLYNTNEPLTMMAARQTVAMKPVLDQALIDAGQSQAVIAAIANAVPYANRAALPVNSAAAQKAAIALDTGAVYANGGASWGDPIGFVPTPAQVGDVLTKVRSDLDRPSAAREALIYTPGTPGQGGIELQNYLNELEAAAVQEIRGGNVDDPVLRFTMPARFRHEKIILTQTLEIPAFATAHFEGARFKKITNGNALELAQDASAENVTVWFDAGLSSGHGVALAKHAVLRKAKISWAPEDGVYGRKYTGPSDEGAYGAVLDDVIVHAAGRDGFRFDYQANSIVGKRLKAMSCGGWGLYLDYSVGTSMDVDLEGNKTGGLRVIQGEATRISGYLEGNGRYDLDPLSAAVWIGVGHVDQATPVAIDLSGLYVYRGHESLKPANTLLRLTRGSNINLGQTELRNNGNFPGAASLVIDGTYGSATIDSDLTPTYYDETTYTGGDFAVRNGGLLYGGRVRRKNGDVIYNAGDTTGTITHGPHLAFGGGWNQGRPKIGSMQLFESTNGVLRVKNGDPSSNVDGSPLNRLLIVRNVPPGVETSFLHYLGIAPSEVIIIPSYSAAGTPPPRVWQTKAPDANSYYLTAEGVVGGSVVTVRVLYG